MNRHQNTKRTHDSNNRRAPVTHQRQGQSNNGQHARYHAHIDKKRKEKIERQRASQ